MRRFWAVALVSVLFAATAAAAPAYACACGAVATPPGGVAAVSGESAIISYANGIESIALSLDVDSAVAGAGLIIPTPAPATVTAADPALFDALDAQAAPREHIIDDWWGSLADRATAAEPTVVSRITVGGLEATTVAAGDSGGLAIWLQQHGFELSIETSAQLAQYADKGWFFTAITLANEKYLDGRLDPIQISFASPSLVYPLGLSRALATEQTLRLSVLSDHRTQLVQAGTSDAQLNAAQRVVWAGPVTDPTLAALGSYLTVVDVRLDSPATQVSGDIGVVLAPNDTAVDPPVVVIRPIELLGFPLGTLLAVWGGIGLLCLLGAIIARSRLR